MLSVAAGVADEERGMLDSLVDDKATAGAQEPPDDVHTERFGNLGVDLNSPYARTPMAPMVGVRLVREICLAVCLTVVGLIKSAMS